MKTTRLTFKEHYLSEAPIMYDDNDKSQVRGRYDKDSGTFWDYGPDEDATVDEIATFVSRAMNNGTLPKEQPIGNGSCRTVVANDRKTIFKYTYNPDAKYGEQTAQENSTYEKYGKKFLDVVPKMYNHGKHWSIQEFVGKFTEEKFLESTGVDYKDWVAYLYNVLLHSNEMIVDPQMTIKTQPVEGVKKELLSTIAFFEKLKQQSSLVRYVKAFMSSDPIKTQPILSKIDKAVKKSKTLQRILKFCRDSKTKLVEIQDDNLGFRANGDMVLLDYGLSMYAKPKLQIK